MPFIAVASRFVDGLLTAGVDGEVQCLNAWAASGRITFVGVGAAFGVSSAMPCVGVALCHIIFRMFAVVDGEVECLYALAAGSSGGLVRVGTAFGVRSAMPCVAVALGDVECLCLAAVDGEVQCLNALAACSCSGLVGVSTACIVRNAVPCVAVALCHVEVLCLTVVDGEIQCLCPCAASLERYLCSVGAAFVVGCSVPCVVVAFCNCLRCGSLVMVDCQVEVDSAVACRGCVNLFMHARGGVGLSVAIGPCVGLAGVNVDVVGDGAVDGEMQHIVQLASVLGGAVEGVVAAGVVCRSMPCVRRARADSALVALIVVDGEVQGFCLGAAGFKVGDIRVGAACGVDCVVPCVALASLDDLGGNIHVVIDCQHEGLCLGAASLKVGDIRVGATFSVGYFMPSVFLAG